MNYIAYTDGSYGEGNGKKVYASAAIYRREDVTSWSIVSSTGDNPEYMSSRNVAGEVLAVIKLCQHLLSNNKDCTDLTIYYDYLGIENWVTGAWKTNKSLTIYYRNYMREVVRGRIRVTFKHVKGHSGDSGNNEVDKIAKRLVQEYLNG